MRAVVFWAEMGSPHCCDQVLTWFSASCMCSKACCRVEEVVQSAPSSAYRDVCTSGGGGGGGVLANMSPE